MRRAIILLIGMSIFSVSLTGQKDETLFGKSGLRFSGAWGASTTSLTFFEDDFAVIAGGYGGLEFNKDFFIGWGGYKTTDEFELERYNNDRFSLKYNGLMLGYSPKASKLIHPKFMLLSGTGKLWVYGERSDAVFVFQPSAGVEINLFRWFRLGLDGGYRFVTDTDLLEVRDTEVSAPYGEITFKFGWSWGK